MAKRLSGLWLFSDLDGTLLATPHASGGKYVSLTASPCLAPLQRWLSYGGNLCIVTTADHRVIDQVYHPLREMLSEEPVESLKARECHGELLLSLFCGSVLYRCTKKGVASLPYVHPNPDWQLTMAPVTARAVVRAVSQLFTRFAVDVLLEREPALSSMAHLSQRYRFAWKALQRGLDRRLSARWAALEAKGHALPQRPSWLRPQPADPSQEGTDVRRDDLIMSNHLREWQADYLVRHPRILQQMGAVRCEDLTSDATLMQLVNGASRHPSRRQRDPTVPVVQIIVAGIPMRASRHYFEPFPEELSAAGVTCTIQPNSIVLTTCAVTKATPLEYLTSTSPPPSEARGGMWGAVGPTCAISLGDHPASVDKALTVLPGIPFVSMENGQHRLERHRSLSEADVDAESHSWMYHGGEEQGCARFITSLVDAMLHDRTLSLHASVPLVVQRLRGASQL